MRQSYTPTQLMDRESRSNRYYRNAVERHWDPWAINLDRDVENLASALESSEVDPRTSLNRTVNGIAKFGAGEDAVTEDLAPLAVVLDDIDDQLFLTTQLYEEAKHADFFDRYWREVVWTVEDRLGLERSSPRDDRWFPEPYLDLFDRNRRATHRLLTDDTPENRAKAYAHYHLTIEGILAQTGYYGMQRSYDGEFENLPTLPGLVAGFQQIRADEGRHVGFGMAKLEALVESGVEPELIEETVTDLLELVTAIVEDDPFQPDDTTLQFGPAEGELAAYAVTKHQERLEQIFDDSKAIPTIEELTSLDQPE